MDFGLRMSSIVAAVLVVVTGCGDDGDLGPGAMGSSGSTGSVTTSTSGADTSADETSTSAATTADATTIAETTDAAETTAAEESGTTEDTGSASQCDDIEDQEACRTAGCVWLGSGNEGNCVSTSDMCSGVMFQMQCNFISGCVWNEELMVCTAAG